MTEEGPDRPRGGPHRGPRPAWARTLFRLSPWGLRRGVDQLRASVEEIRQLLERLEQRLDGVERRADDIERRTDAAERQAAAIERRLDSGERRLDSLEQKFELSDQRFDGIDQRFESSDDRLALDDRRRQAIEQRLDAGEAGQRALATEFQLLRDDRTARLEQRLDAIERAAASASSETERLRDSVVPAVVERGNVLIERLSEELEELASLVERMLLAEPLPVPAAAASPGLEAALAELQPRLLEAFRGPEHEIRHRLERYLAVVRGFPPVLDLGCGRGELLLLLREAGIEASGVEADPALAQAARRRGLAVVEGEALAALSSQPEGRWGTVTAIHLFEHLEPAALLALLAAARRALRPGGLLVAECPNPHTLRVGAALYWRDPTHRRPLLPETLELYLEASGFAVVSREELHPFPDEQRLAPLAAGEVAPELAPLAGRVERLARALDDLLNGARDFVIVAERPRA